jgi:hypothetical protein
MTTSTALTDALSRFAESHGVIFMNVVSRKQAIRLACRSLTFHVEATDEMYNVARQLGTTASGRSAPVKASRSDSVALWTASLRRFGAEQLNARYRARYSGAMDGGAWAGWMAVKAASEAALRVRPTNATVLRDYFESASTRFDGHKGWPLSFRRNDHQLRQPLYIVAKPLRPGTPMAPSDVPDLGSVRSEANEPTGDDRSADRMLDRLSPTALTHACPWRPR